MQQQLLDIKKEEITQINILIITILSSILFCSITTNTHKTNLAYCVPVKRNLEINPI